MNDKIEKIEAIKNAPKSEELLAQLDPDLTRLAEMKGKLSANVANQVKDSRLAESYREYERSKQKYSVDINQYTDENARKVVQAVLDSGLGDNSNAFHHTVDFIANLATKNPDLGFDLTNNKLLKGTVHYKAGMTTNGYKVTDENGTRIVLNVDSPNALRTVVGHEFTHVLEGTELYGALADSVLKYCETKEGLDNLNARIKEAERKYKGDTNTTPEKEVVADLIGEYVFTDYEFINNLCNTNHEGFLKLFDEIKYMARIATAGSKEARDLARVKNDFEKVFREYSAGQKNTAETGGVQRSISKTAKIPYGDQLEQIEKGKMNGSNSLYVGTPSDQLQTAGFSDAPFAMNQSDYRKSRRKSGNNKNYSSHAVPYEFFKNMPKHLGEAPLLIDNGTKVSVITSYEMKDTRGNDSYVIAGAWRNQQMESDRVNLVKSAYPLDDFATQITRAAESGKLVVINKNKAEQMLATIGIQPAEVSRIINLANGSLSQQADSVNTQHSFSQNSKGDPLTEGQRVFFKDAKTTDELGRLKPFYHGTARADRVGTVFDPNRATSGPMAFFTDNRQIADNYARDKADTSLEYDEMYDDYYTQFRTEINGKNMSVSEAWKYLPASKKAEIREKAKHVKMDEDYENVIYDENEQYGVGGFDAYTINLHKGNILEALTDSWLESGTIYGEEQLFLDVLKLVGLDDVQYMNPDFRAEKTYEVYLNITNPFDTSNISTEMLEAFRTAAKNAEFVEGKSADTWDKRNIAPEEWIERLEDDIKKGTTHSWTSIPDFVTDVLKEHGYDGIFDTGGKGGGVVHTVAIPFYSEQIKNTDNLTPTTDPDIRYSRSDSDGKKLTEAQIDYFIESKMRDENGNLKVMYHGSKDAGFHIFDSGMSDDDISFFFVDRNDVAASYSGTTETYEARTIRTAEDMNNFLAEIGYDHYTAVEKNGKFELLENNEHVAWSDTAKGIYEEFCWYEGVGEGDANYKVYLNLKNPLIVDAEGRNWDNVSQEYWPELYEQWKNDFTEEEKAALIDLAGWEDYSTFKAEVERCVRDAGKPTADEYTKAINSAYWKHSDMSSLFSIAADNFSDEVLKAEAIKQMTTRDYAQRAKEQGYDGVIFKNIVDIGEYGADRTPATVAIAFDSNQIKSVRNENPTSDPDIRFSISEDTQGRQLTNEQQSFFQYAKTTDELGRLKPFYHGTARADRVGTVFDPSRATSGPMAFFTDNRQIADNYARDKADTSLEYDEMYDDYYTQFRTEINGKNMSVSEAWKYLPASKKAEIREKAKHVKMDEDYENVIYDENEQYGVGGFVDGFSLVPAPYFENDSITHHEIIRTTSSALTHMEVLYLHHFISISITESNTYYLT